MPAGDGRDEVTPTRCVVFILLLRNPRIFTQFTQVVSGFRSLKKLKTKTRKATSMVTATTPRAGQYFNVKRDGRYTNAQIVRNASHKKVQVHVSGHGKHELRAFT